MAFTAQTPLDEAKALLNDVAGTNYTDAVLLPFIQKAYRELQVKMLKAGLQQANEVSASITVPAGITVLSDGALLPIDLLIPVSIHERGSTSERWSLMTEETWEPSREQATSLGVWAFREEEIKFVGATTDRLIYIKYKKYLPGLDAAGVALKILDSTTFLAARTAAIAALVVGHNPTRAAALNDDAVVAWEDLKGTRVKARQSNPVRRRVNPFRR